MADLDTPLKRLSGINPSCPWRGLFPLPDGTISKADRQTTAYFYSGIAASAPPTTAAITGTVIGATEANIVSGGRTIIITLTNDTWVASGATFNAQRQNIINGLNSAQAEAGGWNATVRATEVVTAVIRTSATVVTITLSASATYNITAAETITVTVPSTALVNSASDVTGSPTFQITPIVVTTGVTGSIGRFFRDKKKRGRVIRYADFTTQEAYAAALAEAAIPLSKVTDTGEVQGESEIEDDDAIIRALFLRNVIH